MECVACPSCRSKVCCTNSVVCGELCCSFNVGCTARESRSNACLLTSAASLSQCPPPRLLGICFICTGAGTEREWIRTSQGEAWSEGLFGVLALVDLPCLTIEEVDRSALALLSGREAAEAVRPQIQPPEAKLTAAASLQIIAARYFANAAVGILPKQALHGRG